ncbi:MAG: DUF3082 domain-containing protein [Spirulinaceae cyanobacterium RM2_2_10]|nr:DUF3082 domain-containing protein [Spirulinaceae cyanobacterium SM2_1_0]NJO21542.1 DUF3082 domain-containing protein [Spirulinaceae cyanobacterium RM2_2_10]
MTDQPSSPASIPNPTTTPLRCFIGAVIAGALASAMYALTRAIATNLAAQPLPTVNVTATNIAIAVRTLVIGAATLATGVFGLVTLGLLLLALQLLRRRAPKADA